MFQGLFGGGNAPQQQQPAQQPAAQQTSPAAGMPGAVAPAVGGNGMHDPRTTTPPQQSPKDPTAQALETANALYTPEIEAALKQQASAPQIFDVNADALSQLAGKMNFVPDTPEVAELAQKALGGDSQALMQLLNSTGQALFAQNAKMMGQLINGAAAPIIDSARGAIAPQMRAQEVTARLAAMNAAYTQPALKASIDGYVARAMQAQPNASAEFIAKQTDEYMRALSATLNPQTAAQQPQFAGLASQGSQDFSNFFPQRRGF